MREIKIKHYYHQECTKCKARLVARVNKFNSSEVWVWLEDQICVCGRSKWKIVVHSEVIKLEDNSQ
jgi:hypothetical protein